MFGLTKSK